MWTANPHTFQNDDTIAPPRWIPRCLITTTTPMADYMLVIVPQKILSLFCNLLTLRLSVSHSSSSTSLSNDSRFLALAIFIFFFLCSVSPSTVCLFTARKLYAHAPSPLLHFWWMSCATYRPGIGTTAFAVVFSGSLWTQIFLKWCRGRRRKKRLFWSVWTAPKCEWLLSCLVRDLITALQVGDKYCLRPPPDSPVWHR